MKLNKKKVIALALVVCLIATLSMGSLAWFTDSDSVTNDFQIAGSENQNPDDVFSMLTSLYRSSPGRIVG